MLYLNTNLKTDKPINICTTIHDLTLKDRNIHATHKNIFLCILSCDIWLLLYSISHIISPTHSLFESDNANIKVNCSLCFMWLHTPYAICEFTRSVQPVFGRHYVTKSYPKVHVCDMQWSSPNVIFFILLYFHPPVNMARRKLTNLLIYAPQSLWVVVLCNKLSSLEFTVYPIKDAHGLLCVGH